MKTYFIAILASLVFILSSCDKDDPIIPNEEELITTVNYTLTSTTGEVIELSFRDLTGGQAPLVIGGTLKANTVYSGSLSILNEIDQPVTDITSEILEEGVDHQFFYNSTIADLVVTYKDQDNNGDPLGLLSTLTTGNAGQGTLTIILRHEPTKDGAGVASGDIANAGGETDIEVVFDVAVE